MFTPRDLPQIGIGELSRNPRGVLKRVLRGERLIVCRHGHPVATLQPLNGCVTQPFEASAEAPTYDLGGRPLGDLDRQIAHLTPAEKKVLMHGIRWDHRIKPAYAPSNWIEFARDWQLRGLVRKTRRGLILTGRGMVLREALLERAGKTDQLFA